MTVALTLHDMNIMERLVLSHHGPLDLPQFAYCSHVGLDDAIIYQHQLLSEKLSGLQIEASTISLLITEYQTDRLQSVWLQSCLTPWSAAQEHCREPLCYLFCSPYTPQTFSSTHGDQNRRDGHTLQENKDSYWSHQHSRRESGGGQIKVSKTSPWQQTWLKKSVYGRTQSRLSVKLL